jgi:predicted amidophosphoribosyltransferase
MSISCASCRRDNDPWRNFCGGCGGALPGSCKQCSAVNRPDDKFCGGCGKALRAVPSLVKQPQKFASTVPIDITDVISESDV